jgi:hypothetical protein
LEIAAGIGNESGRLNALKALALRVGDREVPRVLEQARSLSDHGFRA